MSHTEKLNLITVYRFGKALHTAIPTWAEDPFDTRTGLALPLEWLHSFLHQTRNIPFPKTHAAADALERYLTSVRDDATSCLSNSVDKSAIDAQVIRRISELLEEFERQFEIDSPRLPTFCLTKKGDRDINILLEDASEKYDLGTQDLRRVMPEDVLDDLRAAGKCLVFELPTACAFHVCRATEGLMRAYYKKLTTKDWPTPGVRADWKNLVDQLGSNGAPKPITNRLDEIREDRNSFAHPDVTVSLDDGPVVYDLCTNIMHLMAKEMI